MSCKPGSFTLDDLKEILMVIKRVHGQIHSRMHANAVNEQYVQLSWECGALISQAVQNGIFSNTQHFNRHYK